MTKKMLLILFCSVLIISCGKKADPEYKESKIYKNHKININVL
tara:strand:+ start:266 stop:394 length:129 start_codon:yes stop_codon:yes gene_type:complete